MKFRILDWSAGGYTVLLFFAICFLMNDTNATYEKAYHTHSIFCSSKNSEEHDIKMENRYKVTSPYQFEKLYHRTTNVEKI